MPTAYHALEQRFSRLARLEHALTFLHWDQLVMMPPGGNEPRAEAIAELTALHHELLTTPEIEALLAEAGEREEDPEILASVREMTREHQWAASLPVDLVRARSLAGSTCEHGWRSQRPANDWAGFLENFRPVVRLAREEAQARQEAGGDRFPTPYDALLDLYCTGDSSELIASVFTVLAGALPELIEAVRERQADTIPVPAGTFPVSAQRELNRHLAAALGFNLEQGRLDESSHPFSTGVRGDHRITTRFREDEFFDSLKATSHETGHAGYESGLPENWQALPVGRSRNLCIHESQSLLFEKHIFLSRPFIAYFTPAIHARLPETAAFSATRLWRSTIAVKPGLTRVEADELCYPLHVILRYEIESRLINGDLEPEDLPAAWDERMRRYLGLSTAGNYRDGCLQDIHWTDGTFGYFPAYTMGAVNAAQLFAACRRDEPDLERRLGTGDVRCIRDWLERRVWSRGRFVDSQTLMQEATGVATAPESFLAHLKERYLEERY